MGEVSEWLEEAVKKAEQRRKEPRGFRVVVRVSPSKVDEVSTELRRMGIKIIGTVSNFIFVDVDTMADVERISKIDGVVYVSKEKFFVPMAFGLDELFQRIGIMRDPILKHLTMGDLTELGFKFKPAAEIPNPIKALIENVNVLRTLMANPTKITQYLKWEFPFGLPVLARADWRLVTFTRGLMDAPRDNNLSSKIKVGVIDSELIPHPAFRKKYDYVLLNEPSPMGHGQWVSTCAFGDPCPTRYGHFKPVASAASGRLVFVKTFGGFGPCSSYQVMKAMEICAEQGCKVVNMSLGGSLTEPIDKDPECLLLDDLTKKYGTIFCVAAGNDDDKWKISSPGAALEAVTVAAMDWAKPEVSSYSSRGFQGDYYAKHKDIFEEHLAKYGENFLKPDVAGIGGDRNTQIVAGVTPWFDGCYDFIPDGFDLMIGTSMATPHVAGVVSLLVDRGAVTKPDDIKLVMKLSVEGEEEEKEKNPETGYGLLKYSYFRGG